MNHPDHIKNADWWLPAAGGGETWKDHFKNMGFSFWMMEMSCNYTEVVPVQYCEWAEHRGIVRFEQFISYLHFTVIDTNNTQPYDGS